MDGVGDDGQRYVVAEAVVHRLEPGDLLAVTFGKGTTVEQVGLALDELKEQLDRVGIGASVAILGFLDGDDFSARLSVVRAATAGPVQCGAHWLVSEGRHGTEAWTRTCRLELGHPGLHVDGTYISH